MESERTLRILLYCLKENTMIAQSKLAEQFQVSQSTIRLETDKIERFVFKWDLQLLKKRGVGVCIEGKAKDKEKAIVYLDQLLHSEHQYKEDELECNILLYLFQHMNTYVRIADLADAFYVSESLIQKRLTQMKEHMKLSQIQLKVIQNKGIMIQGTEAKVRKFFAKLMSNQRGFIQNEELIISVKDQIMDMLGIESNAIFKGIDLCEQELNKAFSDEARNALAIHIAIAIKRSYQHKNVPCSQYIDQNNYEREYEAANHLFVHVMNHYGIGYNEDEVYYLFLHLISAKVIEDHDLLMEVDSNASENVVQIAQEIAVLVRNVKQIEIEQSYIENLILHLRPMMNRLEYGMELENPLLNEIKTSFPEAYGIAWMCNTIVRKYVNCELSEHEAGFIAMHIQAMIESNKKDIRVVIVCSSGVGVSQLLATQIEKHFSSIHVVAVDSLASFQNHHYGTEIDLVLSTFPLKSERPLLIVNSFLTSDDIHAIHHFMNEFHIHNKSVKKPLKVRSFLHQNWDTQAVVIQEVAKQLLLDKEVTEAFEASVHQREMINSTAIGMHIAIPHASFETITTTQIVVVTLNQPILWGVDEVDLVIFVLVTEQDTQWANVELKKIYRKLYTDSFHQSLLKIESEAELIEKNKVR